MPPDHGKIGLIDPLTLLGHQILELVPRFKNIAGRIALFNTAEEDDHQVADVGGQPMLVPPLESGDELDACSAFLVASDTSSPRLQTLIDHLERHPNLSLVDCGHLEELRQMTLPAVPAGTPGPEAHRIRVPHPAAVAAIRTLRPLMDLGPIALDVMAMEPVSAFGRDAIGRLARQATARLQGQQAEHDIGGETLAFSSVAAPAGDLQEDLTILLPDLAVAAGRLLTGWFHGHVTRMAVMFDVPVEPDDITSRWKDATATRLVGDPLRLDAVVNQEEILLAVPALAANHRVLAVTAMSDGLLIGGAVTALELLSSLM